MLNYDPILNPNYIQANIPFEAWLHDITEINQEIEEGLINEREIKPIESKEKLENLTYQELVDKLIINTATSYNIFSADQIQGTRKYNIECIIYTLVHKLKKEQSDQQSDHESQKPIKLIDIFVAEQDHKNPFVICNYGEDGFRMYQVLTILYPKEFGIVNKLRNYREL